MFCMRRDFRRNKTNLFSLDTMKGSLSRSTISPISTQLTKTKGYDDNR
jgi:hypothetical protein